MQKRCVCILLNGFIVFLLSLFFISTAFSERRHLNNNPKHNPNPLNFDFIRVENIQSLLSTITLIEINADSLLNINVKIKKIVKTRLKESDYGTVNRQIFVKLIVDSKVSKNIIAKVDSQRAFMYYGREIQRNTGQKVWENSNDSFLFKG